VRPLLAALALASLAVAAPVGPAAEAQEGDAASVVLVDQDAWVLPDSVSLLRVRIEGPNQQLELRFELHDSLSTRTGFEQSVEGRALGPTIGTSFVALADRPLDDRGEVTIPLGIGEDVEGPGVVALPAGGTGVYPLQVELAAPDGEALDSFVTWLVVADPDPAAERLGFSWVWSLGEPPLSTAAGRPADAVVDTMVPGGALDAVAGLLERSDRVALTLSVSPQTMRAWQVASDDPDVRPGLVAVRNAAQRNDVQVLASPYVPLDFPSVEISGLGDQVPEQLLTGVDTLERALGVRVDTRTLAADSLDDAALLRLQSLFVDRLVVPDDALVPVAQNLTPARPFTLQGAGTQVRAFGANAGLRALLEGELVPGPEPNALRAQRFLAGLSLIALEAPASPRGVVVWEPMPWDPEPGLIDRVLVGLRGHPLVRAQTLDGLFARVPDDTVDGSDDEPLVRTLAPIEPDPLPFSITEYDDVESQLASFARIVGGNDPLIRRGDEALRVAPSSLLDGEEARNELALVRDGIANVLDKVSPTPSTVTLTSRTAEIPLSFRNEAGQPVRVRVRLASSKLLFPDGSDRVVELAEGNTTMQVPVESRASGTFTMTVTLSSTDGYLEVGDPTRVRVRSTVFSGVGWWLSIGAGTFLVLWWASSFFRRRRLRDVPVEGGNLE
jgi:hypothetical protein